jgi:hypothetical protein
MLVIHTRRERDYLCPLAVSEKFGLLNRSLSCPRPSSGSSAARENLASPPVARSRMPRIARLATVELFLENS